MRPWLMRIAANQVTDHFRSEARRRRRERIVALRSEQRGPASSEADVDGFDPALAIAIGGLAERHQLVLSLRFLADLTTQEAAAALEVTPQHLAVLQHRALKLLRARLEEARP